MIKSLYTAEKVLEAVLDDVDDDQDYNDPDEPVMEGSDDVFSGPYQLQVVPVVPQQLHQSKCVQDVASRNMIRESGVLLKMPYVISVTTRDTTMVSASPRL